MLRSAFIFYSVGRYDGKGKQLLKTPGKNDIIDMGFRNMLSPETREREAFVR